MSHWAYGAVLGAAHASDVGGDAKGRPSSQDRLRGCSHRLIEYLKPFLLVNPPKSGSTSLAQTTASPSERGIERR